jgi:hypothetical protein
MIELLIGRVACCEPKSNKSARMSELATNYRLGWNFLNSKNNLFAAYDQAGKAWVYLDRL